MVALYGQLLLEEIFFLIATEIFLQSTSFLKFYVYIAD